MFAYALFFVTVIDPSTVFSTLDMDQLEKTRRHHCKERLKISKTAKFESDTSLASKDIAQQSCQNLQTFVWWGGGQVSPPPPHPPTPIQTSIKFRDFEELNRP